MKKVNIELTESTLEKINSLYQTQKEGLMASVENYLVIQKGICDSLKHIFTREELITLLDIHNGTMINSKFSSPNMLIGHLQDADLLEGTCTRQGSTLSEMVVKIEKLTHPQSLVLIEECWRFWYVGDGNDIEKFIQKYI